MKDFKYTIFIVWNCLLAGFRRKLTILSPERQKFICPFRFFDLKCLKRVWVSLPYRTVHINHVDHIMIDFLSILLIPGYRLSSFTYILTLEQLILCVCVCVSSLMKQWFPIVNVLRLYTTYYRSKSLILDLFVVDIVSLRKYMRTKDNPFCFVIVNFISVNRYEGYTKTYNCPVWPIRRSTTSKSVPSVVDGSPSSVRSPDH